MARDTSQQNAQRVSVRKPVQERSRQRFNALLSATEQLLAQRDFADVSLIDIAQLAQVPRASAYHFFTAKEAAFIALAERYLLELDDVINAPLTDVKISNWPDLIVQRASRAVNFINNVPAFGKIFLGGSVINEVRRMDIEYVSRSARLFYTWLDQYVVMPYLLDSETKLTTVIGIYDGIWMTSFARHGRITSIFAEEAVRATLAYCRTFLPEVLPLRAPAENNSRYKDEHITSKKHETDTM